VKQARRARTKQHTTIVYWLVPARPHRDLFAKLIAILARELKAPRFEPHLTICSAPDGKEVRDTLGKIASERVRLRVRGVGATKDYTKSLFVRFVGNAALEGINRKLRRAAKVSSGSIRDPHISLLYKDIPIAMKKELAAVIRLPFREVVFDSVQAVRCPFETKSSADVASWRVVATKKLRA
jgi:2'-5' RNA ligase